MSTRRGKRTRGQSLVEFALVFPVFMVIVVGTVDVGRAVFSYNTLTNGAREGARLAAVNQDIARVQSRTASQAITLGLTNASITVNYVVDDGTDPADNPACDSPIALDCQAVVQASYTWAAITPLIGQLIGPQTFTAISVEPIEFTCPSATTNAANCPRQP